MLCFLAPAQNVFAQAGKKYAVLVGVSEYQHDKLKKLRFTENDVAELADVLKNSGYEVKLLTDSEGKGSPANSPSKANIDKAISEVLKKCQKSDTVVIALAGHGLQFQDKPDSYFCPTEAKPFSDEIKTLVSVTQIYAELEKSFAGVKVLLVDACRDDPNAARGASRGIDADTAPRPPRGVAALFSCSAGEVSCEHDRYKHGVFFHFVLEGLRKSARERSGDVTFDGLSKYVRDEVAREVPRLIGGGARQSPNMKADLSGASPVLVGQLTMSRPVLSILFGYLSSQELEKRGLPSKSQPVVNYVIPGGGGDLMGLKMGDVVVKLNGQPTPHQHNFIALTRNMKTGDPIEITVVRDRTEIILSGKFETTFSENEALRRIQVAAADGDPAASTTLGISLIDGLHGTREPAQGIVPLRRASDQGHLVAMHNLGICASEGKGMVKSPTLGFELTRKVAEQGFPDAQYVVGTRHANGSGVTKNDAEAFQWFMKAAEQEYPNAMLHVGNLFLLRRGTEKNVQEGLKWYRKAVECEFEPAELQLAYQLRDGKFIDKDQAESLVILRRLATRSNHDAENALGWAYANGLGVPKDGKEAERWFELAANAGNLTAQINLANAYRDGKVISANPIEAARWYQRAAAQNSPTGQFELGMAYFRGHGVAKDEAAAFAMLRKAADQDFVAAWTNVGVCHERGIGTAKNLIEAASFYRKAAEKNEPVGCFLLGQLYFEGRGLAKDEAEGVKWFRKGADNNHGSCKFLLGKAYENGSGVAKDEQEAIAWYRKAALQDNPDAIKALKRLNAPVNP